MIRTAFSTVACPEWTLERVALAAREWGFDGVDLRSWGHGGGPSPMFACEPGMTDKTKVRRIFAEQGVAIAGLSTDVCFDDPIFPPVLGLALPGKDASVREGRHMVQVAHDVGAQSIRVFALEISPRERRDRGLRRICERLARVCDHARNRDVLVLIENEGTFASGWDLVEILERVGSPQLGASYNLLAGTLVEDEASEVLNALGPKLVSARLRDVEELWPAPLGEGDLPCEGFVKSVAEVAARWGTSPWVVFDWDRAGVGGLAGPEEVLPGVAETIIGWSGGRDATGAKPTQAWQSAAPAMVLGF